MRACAFCGSLPSALLLIAINHVEIRSSISLYISFHSFPSRTGLPGCCLCASRERTFFVYRCISFSALDRWWSSFSPFVLCVFVFFFFFLNFASHCSFYSTSLLGLSNAVLNDWLAAELRVKPVSHSLHKHWKGLPNDGIIVFNCLCFSTFYVFIYLYLYVCLIMLLLNISVTNWW